jgi:hypothetical protein
MYARGQQQQVLFSLHSDLKPLSFPSSFGALLSYLFNCHCFLLLLLLVFLAFFD